MTARMGIFLIIGLLFAGLPAWGQQAAPTPLTLEQALGMALAANPALRESAARTAGAAATAARAQAARTPQLRLDSRYSVVSETPAITLPPPISRTVTLGEKENWLTTLGAAQVLYSGGRLESTSRQARSLAQAATLAQTRTRQQVIYQTTQAYLTLLAAQQQREVAGQALAAAEEHLQDAQARLDARAAPKYDVLRAEVGVEEARQDTVRAESGIAIAHAMLLRALGVTEGNYTAAEIAAPTVADVPTLNELLAKAQANRPELQAAEWQLKAAEAAIQAANGEGRPTLSLTGSYQVASPQSPFQPTEWTAALVAGMPLLDGGATRAKAREARALRDQQLAARDTLRATVAADVRAAYARLTSAREQYAVAQKRLSLAEETRRIARVRYREGVGTPTEVADAQAALTRAQQGVTQALTDWQLALAELAYATGE